MQGPGRATSERHRNGRRHRATAAALSRRSSARSRLGSPAAFAVRRSGGRCDPWAVGGCLVLIGVALLAAGIRNFSRAATPVPTNEPTRVLVTTGIHAWTRNPIYLGMFLDLWRHRRRRTEPVGPDPHAASCHPDPLRRRRPRGGLSRAALRRCVSRLQATRAAVALAVEPLPASPADRRRRSGNEIKPCPHRRSRNPARLLCENPDGSGRQRCRFHAPGIRQLGMGAGHCSHLGGSGAAGPADCRHSRPRHHLRHAARWTAGQRRPDQRRHPRLRADAHLRAAVCRSPGGPPVPAQDGKPVRQGRRLGDRPDAQLSPTAYRKPSCSWPALPACRWENSPWR